ncbi:Uncharacterised protein [Rothia kristinae]|nr:Uncharacterised protein [Rothia kristinae]
MIARCGAACACPDPRRRRPAGPGTAPPPRPARPIPGLPGEARPRRDAPPAGGAGARRTPPHGGVQIHGLGLQGAAEDLHDLLQRAGAAADPGPGLLQDRHHLGADSGAHQGQRARWASGPGGPAGEHQPRQLGEGPHVLRRLETFLGLPPRIGQGRAQERLGAAGEEHRPRVQAAVHRGPGRAARTAPAQVGHDAGALGGADPLPGREDLREPASLRELADQQRGQGVCGIGAVHVQQVRVAQAGARALTCSAHASRCGSAAPGPLRPPEGGTPAPCARGPGGVGRRRGTRAPGRARARARRRLPPMRVRGSGAAGSSPSAVHRAYQSTEDSSRRSRVTSS